MASFRINTKNLYSKISKNKKFQQQVNKKVSLAVDANAKAALQYQQEYYPYIAAGRGTAPPASGSDKAKIIEQMRKQGDIVHDRKSPEEKELKED